MSRLPTQSIDGLLLVDKPTDWTSHDVVNCVRRRFQLRKVGHCGTLDPLATGLLMLLLGKATKFQDRLMSEDKVYAGSLCLGRETDSEDRTGQTIATADPGGVTEADVLAAASQLEGSIAQIPPMVSALKKNGRPLYELARQGKVVERAARQIQVHSFAITQFRLPEADFLVHCSKGTYVRTLCADLGKALGCGAHMTELRRLQSGQFQVLDAVNIEQIKAWEWDDLQRQVIPLEKLFPESGTGGNSPC